MPAIDQRTPPSMTPINNDGLKMPPARPLETLILVTIILAMSSASNSDAGNKPWTALSALGCLRADTEYLLKIQAYSTHDLAAQRGF